MNFRFIIPLLFIGSICLIAQTDVPSHRSGITPPTIAPTLRKWPASTMMLNLPLHKHAEMYAIGAMSMEELLERVRTNRFNLYLIEVVNNPEMRLKQALITPEDELVLSNFHRGQPQHP